jgi:hypothetical protein
MKTLMRQFQFLIVFLIATACTSNASAGKSSLTWRVSGSNHADVITAAKIIERRFNELKPGFFDSVKSQLSDNAVTLTFSGWRPTPKQAEFLANTGGKFRVLLDSTKSDPLVTEVDVIDARPSIRNVPELAIRLNDVAAERMAERTQSATGKIAIIEWDGKVLARLRISGPLSRDIALGVASLDDAKLMSGVLRAGRLPPGASFMLLEK